MILGFMKNFKSGKPTNFPEKIKAKIKKTTIRKGNRWKVGDKIHFATGVRTKKYKQFAYVICTSVRRIAINPKEKSVSIEKVISSSKYIMKHYFAFQVEDIAKNDRFDSLDDFWLYFNEYFEGQIITWELFNG